MVIVLMVCLSRFWLMMVMLFVVSGVLLDDEVGEEIVVGLMCVVVKVMYFFDSVGMGGLFDMVCW